MHLYVSILLTCSLLTVLPFDRQSPAAIGAQAHQSDAAYELTAMQPIATNVPTFHRGSGRRQSLEEMTASKSLV